MADLGVEDLTAEVGDAKLFFYNYKKETESFPKLLGGLYGEVMPK